MRVAILTRFLVIILLSSCSDRASTGGIPMTCQQLILVLAEQVTSTHGVLYRFERNDANSRWTLIEDAVPVALGRNGLGLGRGLHDPMAVQDFPVKREGDGKSPAGIFNLSAVFGYASPVSMSGLRMPYIHITALSECIDDVHSTYYNRIISRDSLNRSQDIDWTSSEKMSQAGIYYELGVVVDHNSDPVQAGAGSCIFIHNWADPNETSAGCTEMAPENMERIACWLEFDKEPVLVQMTRSLYDEWLEAWALPDVGG